MGRRMTSASQREGGVGLDTSTPLLTPRDIRQLASSAGISPTKTKGQNFLLDPNTVRAIVERSGVNSESVVTEVGPGLGSLTLGLLDTGAYVGAIEVDAALAQLLPHTLRRKGASVDRFALNVGDALAASNLPVAAHAPNPPTALVANLPYNVATPILLTMLARFESLDHALVMVQREVAERIAAQPGTKIYGAPSVKAAWYGSRELAGRISRQVFWPLPNVDSALVRVRRDRSRKAGEPPRELVFSLIDAAFAQRRKTLRSALKPWFTTVSACERESDGAMSLVEVFASSGIDPMRRGETLSIDEFIALASAAAPYTR